MVCEWDNTAGSYFHGWRHGIVLEVTLLQHLLKANTTLALRLEQKQARRFQNDMPLESVSSARVTVSPFSKR